MCFCYRYPAWKWIEAWKTWVTFFVLLCQWKFAKSLSRYVFFSRIHLILITMISILMFRDQKKQHHWRSCANLLRNICSRTFTTCKDSCDVADYVNFGLYESQWTVHEEMVTASSRCLAREKFYFTTNHSYYILTWVCFCKLTCNFKVCRDNRHKPPCIQFHCDFCRKDKMLQAAST